MTHQQEVQAKPRDGFNEWFAHVKAQQTQRQIEDIKRGLFRREDKIMLLEGILYSRMRDGEEVEDLIQALAILQENKIQDEQLRQKLDNSVIAQVHGLIVFGIGLVIAATVFSYFSLPFCGRSHSKFCVGAKVIPGYVADIFREPARVLPANIKAD